MSLDRVKQLIQQKEQLRLEFKKAQFALPGNLFETICAMLNRDGGDILLGVDDLNEIIGVDELVWPQLLADISSLSNNPQKLDPPFILFPQHFLIEGKHIIHIQIPASSQVHKTNGYVYDRSNEGDFKATQAHQIAELHNQKRNFYTEGTIYPALTFSDFKEELFSRVRQLMRSNNPNHPWLALDDKKMLEIAGLWKIDYSIGQQGYTLAAALLFGKDEVIRNILPHYKIDALVRIQTTERYDDRIYCQTNLIEAYDQIMAFVAKHLPDKFYLQDDQRVSIRNQLFREVVANLIVHREYTNAHPCSVVINRNEVIFSNANNPHGKGQIDPYQFTPYPKNPTIAKFFMQLGLVDELGSGVLNVHRLVEKYGGSGTPSFIEDFVFITKIPIPGFKVFGGESNVGSTLKNDGAIDGAIGGAIGGATKRRKETLSLIMKYIANHEGSRAPDMLKIIHVSERTLERHIKILKDAGLIEYKGDAAQTGGYYLTKKMKSKLK